MRKRLLQLIAVLLAILPFVLIYDGHWTAPDMMTAISDGYGFVGLLLLATLAIFDGRSIPLVRLWGRRSIVLTHESMAVTAIVFLAAHPLVLLVNQWGKLDPNWKPFYDTLPVRFGLSAVLLLIVLMLFSYRYGRRVLQKQWLIVHRILYLGALGASLAHIMLVHHFTSMWEGAVIIGYVSVGFVWVRVVRKPIAKVLE